MKQPTKAELIEELRPYEPRYLNTMNKRQLEETLASIKSNLREFGEAYPLPGKVFAKREADAKRARGGGN